MSEYQWEPVNNMPAVYRDPKTGTFGYKPVPRTGHGKSYEITPYKCYKTGCTNPVVVIYPVVKGRRRTQPSCQEHRRDKLK